MEVDRRKFLKLACFLVANLSFANFAKVLFSEFGVNFFVYAVPGKYPGKVMQRISTDQLKWSG